MIALLQSRSISPEPLTPETELRLCLHPIDRAYSLGFWVEDATGQTPSEADMRKWQTIGDVLAWVDQRTVGDLCALVGESVA